MLTFHNFFFVNSIPIEGTLVFLLWLINKNIQKAIDACFSCNNSWEISMLFVWCVWHLPMIKHICPSTRSLKVLSHLFSCSVACVGGDGRFIAGKFFFFSSSFLFYFLKKYNLVFYVFCVSISVVIFLISNFFSWSFYKNFIVFYSIL